MQIEGEGNGGSQQSSCSDSGHILAFRKILEEEFEPMVLKIVRQVVKPIVITAVKQEIVPVAEDLFRRVVKEEIQPLKEKLLAGGTRNDFPKERTLQLKFSDEVSDTVQTSTKLKSKNNVQQGKMWTVDCGTGSYAKVEITLRKENDSDDDSNSDDEKPHFSKSVYKLKGGIVSLSGLKLGHGKDWTKLCQCRLRANIAQNLEGIAVKEAWTAPFLVIDKRIKHYKKHPLPSLLSEVWRLKNIGRNGKPFKRLEKKKIKKLRDFLFWLYVNPQELQQQILRVGDGKKWETMIAHARTRDINEDKRMYTHKSSGEPQMGVVYDVVGELKGVIDESGFVCIDNLSADKKDDAHNLLRSLLEPSAFEQRYETFFNDEASLPQHFPLADPQSSGGAAPVDPGSCFENHCLPTSLLLEKHKTNAGASENEIFESSSRRPTMNTFEENEVRDLGTSISGADRMETVYDAVAWPDQTWQSSPDLFENIEELMQRYNVAYVEPQVVSTGYVPKGWISVVGVLKWWLSSRRVPQTTRKRKRC